MPIKARLYIAIAIVGGLGVLGSAFLHSDFPDLPRYFSYLLLAVIAATLKIHLPGITGTMSLGFLFILIAIAEVSLVEAVTIGCAVALVQTVWRSKSQPRLIQVLFNLGARAITVTVAYGLTRPILNMSTTGYAIPAAIAPAAWLFLLSNMIVVSGLLSLVESKPFVKVWREMFLWYFPYYLVGAAFAALTCISGLYIGWKPSLFILPMMYLVYVYYRLWVTRTV